MVDKRIYFRILQRFSHFSIRKSEYASNIHFNTAVTEVHLLVAERYKLPKSTAAHLLAALGAQLLNEIEVMEGIEIINKIVSGEVVVVTDRIDR